MSVLCLSERESKAPNTSNPDRAKKVTVNLEFRYKAIILEEIINYR